MTVSHMLDAWLLFASGRADGALHVALQCAQPLSGARLVAGVVHLAPSEYRAAAKRGKPPALSAGYEVRRSWAECRLGLDMRCRCSNLLLAALVLLPPALLHNRRPQAPARLAGAAGACGTGRRPAAAEGAEPLGHKQPAGAQPGACAAADRQGAGGWVGRGETGGAGCDEFGSTNNDRMADTCACCVVHRCSWQPTTAPGYPPLLLAGILLQSEEDGAPAGEEDCCSVLQQACGMMGCQPGGLEVSLEQLLRQTVMDAADAGAGGEGGSKRQRAEPASAADQAAH